MFNIILNYPALFFICNIFQLKPDSVVEDISAGCGVINFTVNRKLLVQVCLFFLSQ